MSRSETRSRGWIAALAILAVAGGALGAAHYFDLSAPGKAAEAKVNPKPGAEAGRGELALTDEQRRQIRSEEVQSVAFQPVLSAIGQIAYNEDLSTPVPSPYSGRVVRVVAKLGDDVRRGMPLYDIESPDIVQAQIDFLTATGALAKAKNAFELARRVASRQEDLHRAGAVAAKEHEQAQSELRSAEAELRAQTGAYIGARERLRLLGRDDAEIQRLELERRTDALVVVRAPIGGTVTLRKAVPGQWVRQDNADPLFAVSDLSTMWLVAKVPETEIGRIRLGQSVEAELPAYPGERFAARVSYIGPAVDPATHRVVVRAEIGNPGGRLKPEMFANFRIKLSEPEVAPAVPVAAIVRDIDAAAVWVEQGDGRYAMRKVKLGLQQDGLVHILQGLQPGDKVVTRGAVFLSNALIASAK
jgi:cobalt-zinc-cadmium efflux system membrane fusion protein